MPGFEELKYTKSQAKKAGKLFISNETTEQEKDIALEIINNWRAAHSFPMQTIYVHLRRVAPYTAIVAQRLKRLHSITQKLTRFPNMSLTSMQDIGGCRIIVENIGEVYAMVDRLKRSRMRHKLKEEYDYISKPKADGYRSYHMVYSYYSDRSPKYNGLFVEIQIRTHIQHIWATAVETMDTFTGDPLKTGKGSIEHREFFIKVSALLKLYEENNLDIEAVKGSEELEALKKCNSRYNVYEKLVSIKEAVDYVNEKDTKDQGYYLLTLNRSHGTLGVTTYTKQMLSKATEDYDNAEKCKGNDEDVVLVSTASFNVLKQAYPNYFVDIKEFLVLINSFLNI